MPLQFRRGLEADREDITPAAGEPIYTTDDKKLYIGDGTTAGGVLVSGTVDGSGTTNTVAYWVDADTLGSLATTTYPTLTELSYIKGLTSAIQTQLNGKEPTITAGTTSQYWRGDKTWQTLNKSDVGLGNVDNTSDLNKPISTATQTALDGKVDENSPITGATKTKITYDSKGLVTAGADATTADIADSTNKRYVTDSDLTKLSNLSGTNTGDQTITLSGAVTGSGTGAITTTLASNIDATKIADGSVTSTEFQYLSNVTSDIQTQLDGKVDENSAITGATKTKITYDSKGLVTAGSDATTADISDSTNKRYVTDADLTKLSNLSGTNTGDQTITLTGDVTGTGTGSFATTIANGVVGTAKLGGDITTAGKALLDDADASAQRTTLGLGTIATQNANNVSITGGDIFGNFTGSVTAGFEQLKLQQEETEFSLIVTSGLEFLTADRKLKITVDDADRDLLVAGNATISGTNTGDQNVFSTVTVSGQSNVVADTTSDTLTLAAGSGISITTDASTDTVTIAATGGGGGGDVYLANNNAFTGANTFTNSTGQIFRNSANQDGVLLKGRSGGTSGYTVEIVPTTLTDSRTVTLANGNTTLQAGTMAALSSSNAFTVPQTITSVSENQLSVRYDTNNYVNTNINSTGTYFMDLAGTSGYLVVRHLGTSFWGFRIGAWLEGTGVSSNSMIGHNALDHSGTNYGNYAIYQNNYGKTAVNASSGQDLILCNNNTTMLTVNSSGVFGKMVPKINSTVTSNTITPNADTDNMLSATGLTAGITIANHTGTPQDGQKLIIRIKDDGTSRSLSWNAVFVQGGPTLPTSTTAGKWMHLGFIYNSTNSKWMLVASSVEA